MSSSCEGTKCYQLNRAFHCGNRPRHHIFGGGGGVSFGGNSLATTTLSNAHCLWLPSQNGLFADRPHRHSATWVRPPSPKARPCESTISKSPSILIEPLSRIVIFVAAISSFRQNAFELNILGLTDPLHPTMPKFRLSSSTLFGNPLCSKTVRRRRSACRCGSAPRFRASCPVR